MSETFDKAIEALEHWYSEAIISTDPDKILQEATDLVKFFHDSLLMLTLELDK